jgi:hypothetical protein
MRRIKWLIIIAVLAGCSTEDNSKTQGKDFFPVEQGLYRVYDVEETVWVSKVETTETYQLRERMVGFFETGGQVTYQMVIDRRDTELDDWVPGPQIGIRFTNRYLDYRENNVSYIKLSFPVKAGREWDGNALNSDFTHVYYYANLGSEDGPFDGADHIKVVISDIPANFVLDDRRFEIYARGIGLVERNFTELTFCQSGGCLDPQEIQDGRILLQRLIEYGQL